MLPRAISQTCRQPTPHLCACGCGRPATAAVQAASGIRSCEVCGREVQSGRTVTCSDCRSSVARGCAALGGAEMMDRRRFLLTSLAGVVAAPLAAEGQFAASARIGLLNNSSASDGRALVDAFRQGMAELGWVDGRNLTIDIRWAESDLSRQPRLVGELIAARSDVIVVAGTSASRAALQATRIVPIVVAAVGDPDTQGLVATLARPGGNIT